MNATIKVSGSTGCAQIHIYDADGNLVMKDICTTYSCAENIANSYNAVITNIN